MLGIFDINMPLLYGEGRKAFTRLQEEIIKVSTDHTLFCWSWTPSVPGTWVSMLAPWPDTFKDGYKFIPSQHNSFMSGAEMTYSMTNAGLSINVQVLYTCHGYYLVLRAKTLSSFELEAVCIPVEGEPLLDETLLVWRNFKDPNPVLLTPYTRGSPTARSVLAKARLRPGEDPVQATALFDQPGLCLQILSESESLIGDCLARHDQWSNVGLEFDKTNSLVRLSRSKPSTSDFVTGGLLDLPGFPCECAIFLAVRYSKGEFQWFCQIITTREPNPRPQARRKARLDLLSNVLMEQVENAPSDQRAHFNGDLNLSVVIGHRPIAEGPVGEVLPLHLSQNQASYLERRATVAVPGTQEIGNAKQTPAFYATEAREKGYFRVPDNWSRGSLEQVNRNVI